MIEPQTWMPVAVRKLRERFGSRLLFVGLQGSYRRGEATEDSDIDILTILDTLDLDDLAAYREVLRTLPEGEKAAGFTCGQRQLRAWPAFELFQFSQDTDAWYGDLQPLLPVIRHEDTVIGALANVSALYHQTAHTFLAGEPAQRAADLKGLCKGLFFAMQVTEYIRHGSYARSRRELLDLLSGTEADLLRRSMDILAVGARTPSDQAQMFNALLQWCGNAMLELARRTPAACR